MELAGMNASNASGHYTSASIHAVYTYFAFLGLLAMLIFLVNAFVIYLYLSRLFLRTITNLCLVFLAVSDLLTSLVVIPLVMTCNLVPATPILCIANDLASRFIAISTILHLLIVSLERYIMIVFPMNYMQIVSKSKTIGALAAIWSFALGVVLIQFSWILKDEPLDEIHRADRTYSLTTYFGIVVPVFLLLVFTYAHTFVVLRRQIQNIVKYNVPSLLEGDQHRQARHEKYAEARAVVIFAVMLFTFVCGWFPYFITGILNDFHYSMKMAFETSVLLVFMRFGTSLVNPLLYTFLKRDFRNVLPRSRSRNLRRHSTDTRQQETQV